MYQHARDVQYDKLSSSTPHQPRKPEPIQDTPEVQMPTGLKSRHSAGLGMFGTPSTGPIKRPRESPAPVPTISPKRPHLPHKPPEVKSVRTSLLSKASTLWSEKHRPTCSKELFGNQAAITKLRQWIGERKKYNPEVPFAAMVTGPPGVGKTSAAHVLLREAGFEFADINMSDIRTRKPVYRTVAQTVTRIISDIHAKKPNLTSHATAIILEEVDGAVSNVGADDGDSGKSNSGVQGLIDFLQGALTYRKTQVMTNGAECTEAIAPIICICNDRSHEKIRQLEQLCLTVRFYPLYESALHPLLSRIAEKESLQISRDQRTKLLTACKGDVRRLYNLLEMYFVRNKLENSKKIVRNPNGVVVDGDMKSNSKQFSDICQRDEFDDIFVSTKQLLYGQQMENDAIDGFMQSELWMMGMMLQHNYLHLCVAADEGLDPNSMFRAPNLEAMVQMAESASVWDLLPEDEGATWMAGNARQALSEPRGLLKPHHRAKIEFSAWLGKNSSQHAKRNKLCRLGASLRFFQYTTENDTVIDPVG